MTQPTKDELLEARPGTVDMQRLEFVGLRGDPTRPLSRELLLKQLSALSAAPLDVGRLDLIVARGESGERMLPNDARLSVERGLELDRWHQQTQYGPEYQLATTRTDFARVVANGQPLELHGDNLFVSLELSKDNLPIGSELRIGSTRLEVTPMAHNGCKKWVQRFGLDAMQLNLAPDFKGRHLRGIYLRVIASGVVTVGDRIEVLRRGARAGARLEPT